LIRKNLDEDPIAHSSITNKGLDAGNLHLPIRLNLRNSIKTRVYKFLEPLIYQVWWLRF
jgi:hypothetical protein